jgi:C-terminal peptidase (prc)
MEEQNAANQHTERQNPDKRFNRLLIIAIFFLLMVLVGKYWMDKQPRTQSVAGPWGKLLVVLENIDQNYVDEVDKKELMEKTLPQVMAELDPHSAYLPPAALQKADGDLEGNFDGIGVSFNVPADTALVMTVFPGGPSERAGVQPGDRIVKVGDRVVAGVKMDQDSIVRLLRGPRGSQVTIQVQRYGLSAPVSIPITRDKIPSKSVDVGYMVTDDIAYIKLSKFTRTSYLEVVKTLAELSKQGMRKLVFDLRDNTGGYVDQALRIVNEFLDKEQLMVYTEGSHRARQDFYTENRGVAADMELVVLQDEGSASSSEIMAGALQDNDRGTIVGRRSYGKGLVQEPIYFSDGSGLRLTVARFYTPTGRSLQRSYENMSEYHYDIVERYRHGELVNADSIPRNDSLKFLTPKGKTVYGGGGIIPDVFVPMDTTRMNPFHLKASRGNMVFRFSIYFADQHRPALKAIEDLPALQRFFKGYDLEAQFLAYAAQQGAVPKAGEWEDCKKYIMTQLEAYIGRSTPLDDNAFYPLIGRLDRELEVAVKILQGETSALALGHNATIIQ